MFNDLPWKRTEKFLRLHASTVFLTFVGYEGYSIASKVVLPTVVDKMVVV